MRFMPIPTLFVVTAAAMLLLTPPPSAGAADVDILEPQEIAAPDFNGAQAAADQSINAIMGTIDGVMRQLGAAKTHISNCARLKANLRGQAAAKAPPQVIQQTWSNLLREYAAYRNAQQAAAMQMQQLGGHTGALDQAIRRMGE